MSVLSNFSVSVNFWDLCPLMRVPDLFSKLYNADKSKHKEESSKLMWAIAMIMDTSEDNIYRNLIEDERKQVVAMDWLKDEKFKWEDYQKYLDLYQQLNSSKLEKDLYLLECKVEERTKFIQDTKYTIEDGDKLDRIISNTPKIYELIKSLRDEIEKGEGAGVVRGKRTESASELGKI